jgi:hypothetical protein
MRFESLSLLAFLAAHGVAQSPQLTEFRSLCPTGEGQETGTKTFDNGVSAEYTCRVKASGVIDHEEPAESAEECASKCGTGCPGVIWQYTKKACVFYEAPVTLKDHQRGSVYLKPLGLSENEEDNNEGDPSGPDCSHEKQACEDELTHQQEISTTCQSENNALKSENQECTEKKDEFEAKSESCQLEKDHLQATADQATQCQNEKQTTEQQLVTCNTNKQSTQNQLNTCNGNKQTIQSQLNTCRNTLPLLTTYCKFTRQLGKDKLELTRQRSHRKQRCSLGLRKELEGSLQDKYVFLISIFGLKS